MGMADDLIEVPGWGRLPCCRFGSTVAIEERLAALVIAGRKRATVWDGREDNPTLPGMRWAVMVGARPVAVMETVAVGRRRFDEIDAAFAALEGEGDGSLRYWQLAHEEYFGRTGVFDPQMWLWWEEFRLIAVIDVDLAAAAAGHVAAEEAEARRMLAGRG
jgi:uncharacterized protein YhfF